MSAALITSNDALDKAGTDSLVKYETALRKSGVSQDVATAKLAAYKAQLTQVNALEQKRREQHLARALSPQLTDIGVSLYSGQAPLTVLLQQGGQIADLLRLSGVEAQNFGKALRDAFSSMIPVMATVAQGLGQFAFGLFQEAGAGVVNFIGKVTGISTAMEIAKRAIVSGREENFKYIASLQRIGAVASTVAATGIAALIAGMILLGLEYKKIIQAEAELTNALATSGGALGISKTEAVAAAEGMASLGVGTLKAVAAITEIAKAGNIGKESLELITKAAIDLEKTAGISIEETAKQYAKLQEDPAKALTDIAQKTGLVDKATLDYVYSLEQQGDKTEAARVATFALASAHAQVASEIRDNWSPIESLWNDIKSAIGRVKQEIYDLTTSNAVVGALRTVWEAVAVTVSEVWFTIKGVGKEIGGIGAQIGAVLSGNFAQAAEIGRQMKVDAAAARQAQDEFTASLLNRSKQETKFFNQNKEQNSEYAKWRKENDQALDKSISKSDKYKAKEIEMQQAVLAGTVSQIEADKALAGWKKIILGEEKTKKDPSENYYAALMREATNNTIAANTATQELTKSEQKLLEVKADPRFAKLTATQQADVIAKYDAAIAAERQTAMTEKLAKAEEHRLKLLGKSEGIGKQYYADMQKLEEFAKVAGWSREEIEELTRAVFKSTPAWKAYEKALEDVNTASRKFQEDSLASQASVLQENQSLDHRLSLLGRTAEEQKAITIEYQRANKIREVDIKLARKLREIEEEIAKAKKKGLPESDYQSLIDAEIQARKDAAEQHKVINREVSVQYAEDMQREIDAIKSGISDSIVTALFEGGKAGSKKLRDVLVNTLRQKVTIVVDAVVNTLLGNVVGSVFGGAGASAGGGGGSILGAISNGFSALTGGLSSSISNSFASFAMSSTGQSLGLSSMAADGMGPPALTNMGTTLGSAAGMLGSGLAGYGISSAISGGYTTGGNTVNILSGISSAFLGPIAGIVGGLVNRAFGRKLKDTGIQGTFGGEEGFKGEAYKFYEGGWFRSDKTRTSELDSGVTKMLSTAFKTMQVQVGTFATTLGLSTDKIAGFTTSMKVSLQGLKDDEIQAKLQEALATANNELAEQVIGTWETTTSTVEKTITASTYVASEYAREGEKAIDTLTRLATSLSTANNAFDILGYTLYESSLAGADMASKLIDVFGGLEKFTTAISFYYDNFYSQEEKRNNLVKQATDVLAKYNLTLPSSNEAYRKLVESQDRTTDSGRELFAVLVNLAPTFKQITDITSEAAQVVEDSFARENEILRLTGQEVLAVARERDKELAALDPTNRALQERIYALQDEQSAIEKSKAAAEAAAQAHEKLVAKLTELARTAMQILDNAVKKEKEAAKSTFDALMKDIDSRRNITIKAFEAQKNMLTAAVEGAKDLANVLSAEADRIRGYVTGMKLASNPMDMLGGALSAQARLKAGDTSNAVLEAATNIDPEMFATWADYATNFFATQGIISDFADKADRQVSEAVSQVALLEHQLELTELQHQADLEHYTRLEEAAKVSLETQIAYYDSILEIANMQLEEALGTKLAVMSLGDAMSNFSSAVARLSMVTKNEVTSVLPSLSGIPSFDVGTNYVPNDMIAQIHKGEAIIPAAYNPSNPKSSQDLDSKVVEVLIEVKTILSGIQTTTVEQKIATDKLVKLIDETTEGGTGRLPQPA